MSSITKLWCATGEHEWERPAQRGRSPLCCPTHQTAPTESQRERYKREMARLRAERQSLTAAEAERRRAEREAERERRKKEQEEKRAERKRNRIAREMRSKIGLAITPDEIPARLEQHKANVPVLISKYEDTLSKACATSNADEVKRLFDRADSLQTSIISECAYVRRLEYLQEHPDLLA